MTVYMKKGNKIVKTLKKDAIAALLAAATMSGGMVLVLPVSATAPSMEGVTQGVTLNMVKETLGDVCGIEFPEEAAPYFDR